MIKFICSVQNCSKSYITEGGFKKHLRNFHNINANPTVMQASRVPSVTQIPRRISPLSPISITRNINSDGNSENEETENGQDHGEINCNNFFDKNRENDEGWDRDQISLALQLSMKEQYPDFIPDNALNSDKKCVICFTNNASMAFINCGHMVTCEECSAKLMKEYSSKKRCPVCRKSILKLLKIYF